MKKIILLVIICIISARVLSQEVQKSILYIEQQTPEINLHLPSVVNTNKNKILFISFTTIFNTATSITYFNLNHNDKKLAVIPYVGSFTISTISLINKLKKEKTK
jgi:hypothetical protein